MRIKPGFKAWLTLSAMLLSLVVISGCNDEGATPTTTPPATNPTPSITPKGPEMTKPTPPVTPPTPTTPKTDEKAPDKK